MATTSQNQFIEKIAPHAVTAMHDHSILASLTIAQSILESAWGKASIGNNVFGIKATGWKGKTQTVATHEWVNGKKVKIMAKFRDYDSIEDSIKDHTSLFTRLDRYKALRGETDYKRACYLVQKAGYATDPNYSTKLITIIEANNLQRFDSVAHTQAVATSTISPTFAKNRTRLMNLGVTDGTKPTENVPRQESWAMLDRLYTLLKEELDSVHKLVKEQAAEIKELKKNVK